jgi:hypothetical protein
MREQHVAIPRWYREPALAIQTELRRPLKHPFSLSLFTHQNPLFTTSAHYIEKYPGGQATKQVFSFYDK